MAVAPFHMMPAPRYEPGLGGALNQALMFMGQGLGQRWDRQNQNQDLQALQQFSQMQQMQQDMPFLPGPGGPMMTMPPQMPQMKSQLGAQLGLQGQMGNLFQDPMERELLRSRIQATKALTTERRRPAKTTKDDIRYWRERGYSAQDSVKNARLAAEISAGIKPRASVKEHYDKMRPAEKLNFLQGILSKAQGQYFGAFESENKETGEIRRQPAANPALAAWAQKEMGKLGISSDQDGWKSVYENMTPEEKITALEALQKGYTPEQIMKHLKNGK